MSEQRVDLNLMNVFRAVMAERNVTRAARRLTMTQPAVSNSLRRLRLLFHDELFLKVSGGVAPTDRALRLWSEIEAPLAAISHAVSPARFKPALTTRIFQVAITESLAARTVPAIAVRFAREAPAARLRFLPHANPTSIAALERGELDCAVGMFPYPPETLQVEGLLSDDYVCAFAAGHPTLTAPLTLEAFASARHVLVKQGPTGGGVVDDWLSLAGLARDIVLTVNGCAEALATVAATDFVTAVPASFLRAHAAGRRIAVSPLPFDSQKILYKLAWHERSERDAGQAWFRRIVREEVRRL